MSHLFRAGFYGTTTLGERGQIVIPVQARKELGLGIGDKVMVFGRPQKTGLMLIKAEDVTRMVSESLAELSGMAEILRSAGVVETETADEGESPASARAAVPPGTPRRRPKPKASPRNPAQES